MLSFGREIFIMAFGALVTMIIRCVCYVERWLVKFHPYSTKCCMRLGSREKRTLTRRKATFIPPLKTCWLASGGGGGVGDDGACAYRRASCGLLFKSHH